MPSLSRARLVIIIRSVTDRQPAVLLCLSTRAEAVHRPSLPTGAGGHRRSNQPAEAMLRARLRASMCDGLRELGLHLARPKPTPPLQPARIDPSRTGSILRLKITRARTVNETPSAPLVGRGRRRTWPARRGRRRRCVAMARREAARPKRRTPPRNAYVSALQNGQQLSFLAVR